MGHCGCEVQGAFASMAADLAGALQNLGPKLLRLSGPTVGAVETEHLRSREQIRCHEQQMAPQGVVGERLEGQNLQPAVLRVLDQVLARPRQSTCFESGRWQTPYHSCSKCR